MMSSNTEELILNRTWGNGNYKKALLSHPSPNSKSWAGLAVSYISPSLHIYFFPSQALTALDDSDQADAYNQVTHSPHKAELSHELLGAAAAYEAQIAYEKHCSENGTVDSYALNGKGHMD
ncbi:unnamed protein product [Aspergillus oryzae]|uniref:Unnamed protein product n=1 Tax=Aspergillus oryzae TaxID=5062 RepID=A0AAN4YWE7_ASPOZ|nr:unnamed protein product [Aspergillus oryzae]